MDNVIGARIRQARTARGMSGQALARAVGMTKSTISKIENGSRRVEGGELADLAHALDVSMRDLVGKREPVGALAIAARLGAAEQDSESAQHAKQHVRHLLELEGLLDELEIPQKGTRRTLPVRVANSSAAAREGQAAAEQLREDLELADTPIGDLADLMESQYGIDVTCLPLGDGPTTLSGLCVRAGDTRIALANSSKEVAHQRFTLAHELAHLLFDDPTTDVHVDEAVGGRPIDPREVRANAFASAFLLPAGALERHLDGDRATEADFAKLLFVMGVSVEALAIRLEQGGVAGAADLAAFRKLTPKQLAVRHNRLDEWQQRQRARDVTRPPTRLYERALAAYAQARIGIGPLAGLLGRTDESALAAELADAGLVPQFDDTGVDVLDLL
jgi:Zn-dependent peptidase ImmA (M78 family)/transcriptional regulator with XRE-family HTH domain